MFKIIRIAILPYLLVTSITFGQLEKFKFRELPKDSLLTIAREIINTDVRCTFITVDEDDKPQARLMSYFPIEEDWKIWLGTFPTSRKASQIKNNPNVMAFFYDPKGRSYVSVAGKARLVNDAELKKKYWKEGWKVFYPDPEKDYILIEITPKRLEICSFKYKLYWDADMKPAFVVF
ncbi:MAG: pyridoxamine 5'-phosphate oxidase family protein [Bacteroidota bacterium]